MTKNQVFDEPSETRAEDGTVEVTGPDAVQVKLTAEAALETGRRLQQSGLEAAQSTKKASAEE